MAKFLSLIIIFIVASLFSAKSRAFEGEANITEIMSIETERVEDDPELIGGLFEGDMIIRSTFNVVVNASRKWPNGVVSYKIGAAFGKLSLKRVKLLRKQYNNSCNVFFLHSDVEHALSILTAMQIIESQSCIRFHHATDNTVAFIQIQGANKGCSADVGYTGRKQKLNLQVYKLGNGCFRIGTILHELLHALGFYHQHVAPERDNYVKIVKENIKEGKESNFQIHASNITTDFGIEYDYESVMHYSAISYSKNGKATIVPLKNVHIGQRLRLSEGDIKKLNLMYC